MRYPKPLKDVAMLRLYMFSTSMSFVKNSSRLFQSTYLYLNFSKNPKNKGSSVFFNSLMYCTQIQIAINVKDIIVR
jgi:hypothetical protein